MRSGLCLAVVNQLDVKRSGLSPEAFEVDANEQLLRRGNERVGVGQGSRVSDVVRHKQVRTFPGRHAIDRAAIHGLLLSLPIRAKCLCAASSARQSDITVRLSNRERRRGELHGVRQLRERLPIVGADRSPVGPAPIAARDAGPDRAASPRPDPPRSAPVPTGSWSTDCPVSIRIARATCSEWSLRNASSVQTPEKSGLPAAFFLSARRRSQSAAGSAATGRPPARGTSAPLC